MIQKDLLQLAHSITELKLLPGNPRRGDIEAVKRSLEAFGQRKPIVVRRTDNVVIAGNHTLQAAQALGWDEIAVVWVDDDEVTSKAFALADNRTAELGDYDEEALADLINDVGSLNPGLLESSGWDDKAVQELLDRVEQVELPTDVDEVPEDVPAVSKLGDVWLLGDHRVMCGDSTNLEMIGKLLNNKTINMVFTDPPYGISIVQGSSVGGSKPFGSAGTVGGKNIVNVTKYKPVINDESTKTAIDSYEICKKLKIAVQIWWGGNYYASALPDSPCWIVWDKENTGNFADAELAWTNQPTATRIFKHMWNGMIRASERGAGVRVHPTQKPIALAVWCFNEYGNEGDIVLDLFGGSGSTLIAAQETNRVAYLMELDPHYVDVICARFQKLTGVLPVLESSGKVHDFLNA
jgi:DNA modification methylase